MKATIKATDCLTGKSMEIGAIVAAGYDYATQLNAIVRKKSNRVRIIKALNLTFGEARLEMVCDGERVAEGTMTNNVFAGGNITTRNCTKAA